ncbi:MAG: dephospho-CoA kinase [Saprospiraceae bacterium]|nr:dephospho-CoA kinase [Saprospiraceae bacterium]
MLKIGITGGMGSGKTTVCRIFESLDIPVYYADIRAKLLMVSDKKVKSDIKSLLTDESYFKNGKPNRPFIAERVFADAGLLQKLNGIIHPAVHHDFDQFCIKHQHSSDYVLNEAALLVENGSYKRFDKIIVVTCPEEIRIQRVIKRDRVSREQVVNRLKNQLPEAEKIKVADFIIDNSGEKSLIPQIVDIHRELTQRKK